MALRDRPRAHRRPTIAAHAPARRLVVVPAIVVVVAAGALSACGASRSSMKVGLMYPTSGSQGVQGTEEKRGAELAATWANAHGGVDRHKLELVTADMSRPEGVPDAMAGLQRARVSVVVGTHGSTYSAVAAEEATRRHMLVWETGAVGYVGWDSTPAPGNPYATDSYETDGPVAAGTDFIRMAPMGGELGKSAVDFVRDGLAPHLPTGGPLRWAVAYVDDPYGRAVQAGAASEVNATGQQLVGSFPYVETGTDFTALAARIAAVHPDALYVSAYIDDGTALRQALAAGHVPLLVNLGTSSSYCMPAFGQRLGDVAVGVFASDKPDAAAVRPDALSREGRTALAWVSAQYQKRYHQAMTSHALSGFSNAYALFVHVLPKAGTATTAAVAAAAQAVKLPIGTLANGGGLDIAPAGAADAGNNRNAAGVIWEWVAPNVEKVVWPPAFATHDVVWQPIDR
ncbi:MAG: ABC transporter substrate-binding protein [Acidimicrobiia bacterium]|nr:ABC transporter substrate-binding protein [Acidimicrobiia bacterium]